MAFKFSESSLSNRRGVDQRLIDISNLALIFTPVDFGIPRWGGIRSTGQQRTLYDLGKTSLDGTARVSHHQFGWALDVFAYVDGKASWDEEHLTDIALSFLKAAQQLDVRLGWGGFWRPKIDMPHFYIIE